MTRILYFCYNCHIFLDFEYSGMGRAEPMRAALLHTMAIHTVFVTEKIGFMYFVRKSFIALKGIKAEATTKCNIKQKERLSEEGPFTVPFYRYAILFTEKNISTFLRQKTRKKSCHASSPFMITVYWNSLRRSCSC